MRSTAPDETSGSEEAPGSLQYIEADLDNNLDTLYAVMMFI
jgi:hypothetical protein